MLLCVGLILLVIFWRAKPVPREQGYFTDYMDPVYTTAIKGVFILLIFLTHGEQYLTLTDSLPDRIYGLFRIGLGQSVVTAFFFYSGYGMMQSLKRKGEPYLQAFPRMRILKTLVHFDLPVLLYLIAAVFMGWSLTAGEIAGSFIGWDSLGNSSWFIFDILIAYVLFYMCFRIFAGPAAGADPAGGEGAQRQWQRGALLFTCCSAAFVILMVFVQESRYYNTFLSVSMGIWFALYQERIEQFVQGKKAAPVNSGDVTPAGHGRFFAILFGLAALYVAGGVLLMGIYDRYEWLYIPLPLLFMAALLLLTMVWRFDNPVLRYFGEHLFSVFILMRLPMELLEYAGLAENVYIFMALSFVCTVILAHVFDLFLQKLDSVLFRR